MEVSGGEVAIARRVLPWNVTTASVAAFYARVAPIYDVVCDVMLRPGRRRALERLAPRHGERILEIGVGTGLSAVEYPRGCSVVAIDFSAPMLHRARRRLARSQVQHVTLASMDAAHLAFEANQFDAVYAPYLLSVVPDPVAVAREMRRVCRPCGRLVFLNHFEHCDGEEERVATRVVGLLARRVFEVNWHLELRSFLKRADLRPLTVERVNVGGLSSVLVCRS